jgi:metal-responsive CopG/Arc/MetJ family transcriptional regulator
MKRKKSSNTVRRSVALPRHLVEEVTALAPPELRQNLNRLVTVALKEFADRQKALEFEKAMAEMAADPGIKSENAVTSTEFAIAETDGLKND